LNCDWVAIYSYNVHTPFFRFINYRTSATKWIEDGLAWQTYLRP